MKRRMRIWALVPVALVASIVVVGGITRADAADSGATVAETPAAEDAASARCCHITIPSNYVYNPNTTYQRTLHDYCTSSPDQFPSPGANADFRGPCSRHDLCYQYHQKSEIGCDNQLLSHLKQECTYRYAFYDPRRIACKDTAEVYYAVVLVHTLWP
jgi:hypothetical protein